MSTPESRDNGTAPEPSEAPQDTSPRARWLRRARRVRNEAGLHLVRGAATAVGGAIVAYAGIWIQTR